MNFEKCFQTASLSLICAGFLSILLAGTISITTAAIFLVALLLGWFRKPKKITKIYQWLVTGLILLTFLTDLLLFSNMAPAVVRLMLALILLKVFTREEKRDYSTLFLLSFSLLLISSTSTISALFVLSAALVLFTFVLSLILFEMRAAYLADPGIEFSLKKTIQTSVVMTLLIMLLAIPIFLVIPRTALGLFGQTQVSSIGFSPSVNLGHMGNMLQNEEVVMRVEVRQGRDAVPPDVKWRGVAMDHFNGRIWSNTFGASKLVIPDLQGRYLLETERYQNEMLIEQSIYLEPISNVIFTSHNPIQLFGFDRSLQVIQSGNQALFLQPKPNKALQYNLFTDIYSRTRRIKAFDPDTPFRETSPKYLQLPTLDPRIKPLTEEIVKNSTSQLGQVLLLESFLRSQFEYSLNHSSGDSPDPLGNFLFSTRTGHCEYFATALVTMLRTLGIPARMINGFRLGEYNEWGDYFIVRQSDAHSWVEACLPGSGWVDFDPTPARPGAGNFSIARFVGKFLDNLDILWTEIVTFDRYKQFGFFRILVSNTLDKWESFSNSAQNLVEIDIPRIIKEKVSIAGLMATGIFIILSGLTGILLWNYRMPVLTFLRKRLLSLGPNEMVREYYREMLRIFKSKGSEKLPAETPGEFLKRIRESYPVPHQKLITDIYIKTRFGGASATSYDLEKMISALKRLRKTEKK
jgi:protein-glutamine gamma-glutamyltransferase